MEIKKAFYRITRESRWLAALGVMVLVLAACAPAAAPTPAPTAVPPAAAPTQAAATSAPVPVTSGEAALSVANDPKLGQILVGNNGMTLYAFTKDGPNQSNCTGKCATNWPALKTQGNPQVGSGVDGSLVGNATLADGTKVVTYNKMPLYYFFKDKVAGDVNGQGVGSVWFTVSPDGKLVGQTAAPAKPAATEEGTSSAPVSATQAGSASAAEATINIATDPKLGKILVNGQGMTLYIFTNDKPDTSTCTGGCATLWPPLMTQGHPTLGNGVDASMIGTATLADGSKVVTYNHMPLYLYTVDKAPGDVKGQGVGSVWFVVGPDGKPVTS